MRELTRHRVNDCDASLRIEVLDEPGSGGANHQYCISFPVSVGNTNVGHSVYAVDFQKGPIAEVGTNGVTHEALLAIIIDRLEAFQKGPYACRENALALTKIEEAMHWLHHRTNKRLARGVEGTHTV